MNLFWQWGYSWNASFPTELVTVVKLFQLLRNFKLVIVTRDETMRAVSVAGIESRANLTRANGIIELIGQTEEGLKTIFCKRHVFNFLGWCISLSLHATECTGNAKYILLNSHVQLLDYLRSALNSMAMRSVFCLHQLRHFLLLNCASLELVLCAKNSQIQFNTSYSIVFQITLM